MPEDTEEPLIELEFTDSPIDLHDISAKYVADISYDQYDKTTFDFFKPESASPTGLVIFIHGGGFIGGDKDFIYDSELEDEIVELLDNGIAVATINYRLIQKGDKEGVLKCLNDSKRALQFMRYVHKELNVDKEKIVLFGSSAGASTSLWLATNDDLRDINSSDKVVHESTRVKGVVLNATQSSLDIESRWLGDVFIDFGSTIEDIYQAYGTETVYNLYGVNNLTEYETPEIDAYRQSVDMLSLLSADDPEIWVKNTGEPNSEPTNPSNFSHHPFHAREIKEYADAAGVTNKVVYGDPILYNNTGNESFVQFLIRKVNE